MLHCAALLQRGLGMAGRWRIALRPLPAAFCISTLCLASGANRLLRWQSKRWNCYPQPTPPAAHPTLKLGTACTRLYPLRNLSQTPNYPRSLGPAPNPCPISLSLQGGGGCGRGARRGVPAWLPPPPRLPLRACAALALHCPACPPRDAAHGCGGRFEGGPQVGGVVGMRCVVVGWWGRGEVVGPQGILSWVEGGWVG